MGNGAALVHCGTRPAGAVCAAAVPTLAAAIIVADTRAADVRECMTYQLSSCAGIMLGVSEAVKRRHARSRTMHGRMDLADALKRPSMLDAWRRIAAEDADVEGPGPIVPELFEVNGRIGFAVPQQQRRAVATRRDAAAVGLQPARRLHEERGRCRPHPRFVGPSIDHARGEPV